MTPEETQRTLAAALQAIAHEARTEIARRKRSPGGQQCGTPRWSQAPLSMLIGLERDCRQALEQCGIVVDPFGAEEE